jgi:hypothetical protein
MAALRITRGLLPEEGAEADTPGDGSLEALKELSQAGES